MGIQIPGLYYELFHWLIRYKARLVTKKYKTPLRVYMSSFKKLNENKTNPKEEGNTYLLIAPEGSEEHL